MDRPRREAHGVALTAPHDAPWASAARLAAASSVVRRKSATFRRDVNDVVELYVVRGETTG
ncbi:hypothetical protein [Streptomyces formicae]